MALTQNKGGDGTPTKFDEGRRVPVLRTGQMRATEDKQQQALDGSHAQCASGVDGGLTGAAGRRQAAGERCRRDQPKTERWPLRGGTRRFKYFLFFKYYSNLIRSKSCIPKLNKFEIIYGDVGFELRNNFPYWNFPRFKIKIKLKFRGLLCIESDWNLI
jgi:hypothetical protein